VAPGAGIVSDFCIGGAFGASGAGDCATAEPTNSAAAAVVIINLLNIFWPPWQIEFCEVVARLNGGIAPRRLQCRNNAHLLAAFRRFFRTIYPRRRNQMIPRIGKMRAELCAAARARVRLIGLLCAGHRVAKLAAKNCIARARDNLVRRQNRIPESNLKTGTPGSLN
jgi:hypothetical protein